MLSAQLIFIHCFPRKVSLKKAILLISIYSLFQPIADSITLYLIAGRKVEYTLSWYLILKLIIIIEMFLPIPLLMQTISIKWYKVYWVFPASIMILGPATLIYVNYFIKTDVMKAYTYRPVTPENAWIYLLGLFAVISTAVILSAIIKKAATVKRLEQVPKIAWLFLNFMIFFLTSLGEKNYFVENNMIKGLSNYKLIFMMFMIAFVAVFFLIILADERVLSVENRLLKKQNEIQLESLLSKQEYDLELHKLYHDIGNHIKTIQLLVESGDKQKASDYANDLLHVYQSLSKDQLCANKIVNAVLLQKMKLCDEQQIQTELEINLPQELPIRDIDLMSVLSNLFDNAIESCSGLSVGDPYIRLKASVQNRYCCFYMVNSKTGLQIELTPEDKKTWKKDKKLHGYGMKIIKEIVNRYQGQQEIKETEEEWQTLVMLKMSE